MTDKSAEKHVMTDEPREFNVAIKWIEGPFGEVIVPGMPTIRTGMPPTYHTPEHLLVAAVITCFMNSFVYFTRRMRIEFESFEAHGRGVLERVGRSFEVARIDVNAMVKVANEALTKKIERALELGGKYCFVGNSLKSSVKYDYEVVVA